MAKLSILKHPDQKLRQKPAPVPADMIGSAQLKRYIDDMRETMHAADGVGLASSQVAIPWRITVITTDEGVKTLINPTIRRASMLKEKGEEGCLSVPGFYGIVRRSKSVEVEALDEHGNPLKFNAEGFLARVIQHEIDHLEGVLYIDKAEKMFVVKELS